MKENRKGETFPPRSRGAGTRPAMQSPHQEVPQPDWLKLGQPCLISQLPLLGGGPLEPGLSHDSVKVTV